MPANNFENRKSAAWENGDASPEKQFEDLPKAEAVVVLAHEMQRSKSGALSPDLESKMRALGALELLQRGHVSKIIFSGGPTKGFPEEKSTAEMMKEYLLKYGVSPESILTEDASKNTNENMENVLNLLEKEGIKNFLLETNEYHLGRSTDLLKNKLEELGFKLEKDKIISAEKLLKARSPHYKKLVSHYEFPESLAKSPKEALQKGLWELLRRILIYLDRKDKIATFFASKFH